MLIEPSHSLTRLFIVASCLIASVRYAQSSIQDTIHDATDKDSDCSNQRFASLGDFTQCIKEGNCEEKFNKDRINDVKNLIDRCQGHLFAKHVNFRDKLYQKQVDILTRHLDGWMQDYKKQSDESVDLPKSFGNEENWRKVVRTIRETLRINPRPSLLGFVRFGRLNPFRYGQYLNYLLKPCQQYLTWMDEPVSNYLTMRELELYFAKQSGDDNKDDSESQDKQEVRVKSKAEEDMAHDVFLYGTCKLVIENQDHLKQIIKEVLKERTVNV